MIAFGIVPGDDSVARPMPPTDEIAPGTEGNGGHPPLSKRKMVRAEVPSGFGIGLWIDPQPVATGAQLGAGA